ncbi:MAG: Opr family porin [Arcobacter sp.]|uniref:Opr family porin n=1 Tax=Arcobacter sp. TaxID=1872629 RepID=UPI003B004942
MKKISIVVSLLLLGSSVALADSGTVKEAFANGKASGDITVYSESKDLAVGTDSGFTAGSIGLSYETDSVKGFSAKVGFRGNTEITEKNDGNYKAAMVNSSALTEANIKYTYDKATIIAGRQEIGLEWLGDYNDAIVAVLDYIPNTSVVMGYTNRQAEIDLDTNNSFTETTKDGAYVVDAKFTGLDNIELNPYYYSAPKVADFYGFKASYDVDMFGLTAHYAASNEDVATTKDGDIYNLEGRLNISDISFALGYVATDKDGGVGSISAWGDSINPMDDGTNIYGTDAKTTYASIGYTISSLGLSALYSDTDYGTNSDTDELNLIANYSFTDELSANITYVDYDDTATANDYDKVFASVTYAF